jgi:hypothetical protein
VLLVGCSREPWLAAKKDEKAFMDVWSKALHMPLPDYAARRVSLPLELKLIIIMMCCTGLCGWRGKGCDFHLCSNAMLDGVLVQCLTVVLLASCVAADLAWPVCAVRWQAGV